MIKNYFKIAWRNLFVNKTSSFINITGLSVGMAVAILIGLWIWDELSFDKYHKNYHRIAQVMQQKTINGTVNTGVAVPLTLDEALRKNYGSDFKRIALASWTGQHILAAGDKKLSFVGNFMGAQGPDMFSLNMLKGNRQALQDPSSILISKLAATALFGDADPIGHLIRFDNEASLTIAGVYEDLPINSSLHDLAFIAPWGHYVAYHSWVKRAIHNWGENSFQLYVEMADPVDWEKTSEKIKDIKLKNVDREDAKFKPVIFLHPMNKWHLYSEFKNGINTGGAIEYVLLFGTIGVFVLLLACINFMNLSTARSEKRAKEVGIRKALGSLRPQLIGQFFCESILMAGCAFVFSLLLVWLILPIFNEVAGKTVIIPWDNPFFWVAGGGFTLFTGLIAGSYPALYLSSFNPVKVLKGRFRVGRLASIPRKALVVLQFTVSVVLIIGTMIVFRQIQFARNRPVGYERSGLINTSSTDDLHDHFNAVRTDLMKTRAIVDMAESSSPMTAINNGKGDIYWSEKDPAATYDFASIYITAGYGKTVGWQLVAGRDFDSQLLTDSSGVILNESAVKYMGIKNPIGEIIRFDNKDHTVIGVTKDMVMQSPYEPVRQTLFYIGKGDFDYMVFKINPEKGAAEAIGRIADVYKTYSPSVPFSYQFIDEEFEKKFIGEQRIGKLAGFFTALAIFISCLGLFGLASFVVEQRTKEIGIRKIVGASIFTLWHLISKDFVLLILASCIFAIPITYYYMREWLLKFQYRATISWWIFAVAIGGALIITGLTVSYQAIRAARANPVKSLRME